MIDQLNPGDYDIVRCPGPGAPHRLAIPKWPEVWWSKLICDVCHAALTVNAELRASERWSERG
jgi:hypothetical protein